MKTSANTIESLSDRVEAYVKVNVDLVKFRIIETGIAGVSSLISAFGGILIIALSSLFLSIGIALWLGDLLGKTQYGFFIVALLYVMTWFVLRFFLGRAMAKISSDINLQTVIPQLEILKTAEAALLKAELHEAYESMRPINLIKSTMKEVAESPDLHNNMLNTAVGLTTGYISKSLFERVSTNPLRKIMGIALLFGVTNVVTKNPNIVRKMGITVFNLFNYLKK